MTGNLVSKEVAQASLNIVSEYTSTPPTLSEMANFVGDILYGPREQWGCYEDGLITDEELVDLLASHLIDLVTNYELPSKLSPPSDEALSQLSAALLPRMLGLEQTEEGDAFFNDDTRRATNAPRSSNQ